MFKRFWSWLFGKPEPIHVEVTINVKEITIRSDLDKKSISGSNAESEKERSIRFITAKPVSDEEAVADLEERLDKTTNSKAGTDEKITERITKPAVKFGKEIG